MIDRECSDGTRFEHYAREICEPASEGNSMTYKHITVKPIAGAIGAEVFGPDLSKSLPLAVLDELLGTNFGGPLDLTKLPIISRTELNA